MIETSDRLINCIVKHIEAQQSLPSIPWCTSADCVESARIHSHIVISEQHDQLVLSDVLVLVS